ncbi:MAG: accessory factor UbiK family protein [Rhodospirillales bacterium]
MQTRDRFFDDAARMAGGAFGVVAGLKREIETFARSQVERLVADMDLVPREEFEAARDMAAKARAQQEELERRIALLEARIVALEVGHPHRTAPPPAISGEAAEPFHEHNPQSP